MKLGYPCVNRGIGCTPNSTFRLANYSEQPLPATVENNLACLRKTLEFNVAEGLEFFRIGSRLVPVLFDTFHHVWLNNDEPVREAVERAGHTWRSDDGVPMVDYSSQQPSGTSRVHAETIDIPLFGRFLEESTGLEFDVLLEIKDKERSALRARNALVNRAAGPNR